MAKRRFVFVSWAVVGLLLTYGALYALSPFGLAVLAVAIGVGWLIPRIGGRRLPEACGVLLGPGVFCLMVARYADHQAPWLVIGAALAAASALAYAAVGRQVGQA